VRAALGGGSPNDLTPALKYWRERVLPTLPTRVRDAAGATPPAIPPQIADLALEIWQRATAAAVVELKGGPTARQVEERTEEVHGLRDQVTALRNQLERESLAYGELRAQAARHEALAREALSRAHAAEERQRDLARDLGSARQRIAELEAALEQRPPARGPPRKRRTAARRPKKAVGHVRRPSKAWAVPKTVSRKRSGPRRSPVKPRKR